MVHFSPFDFEFPRSSLPPKRLFKTWSRLLEVEEFYVETLLASEWVGRKPRSWKMNCQFRPIYLHDSWEIHINDLKVRFKNYKNDCAKYVLSTSLLFFALLTPNFVLSFEKVWSKIDPCKINVGIFWTVATGFFYEIDLHRVVIFAQEFPFFQPFGFFRVAWLAVATIKIGFKWSRAFAPKIEVFPDPIIIIPKEIV